VQRPFVTGGSGFVGRALIKELVQRGLPVRALARSDAAIAAVRTAGAEPVRGDLGDRAALEAGMAGCDVVFHSAALANDHGPRAEFFAANVEGTKNVVAAARAAGARRLVHVSTEALLADGRPIVRADETRPRAARPVGLYPLTKGLAEETVLSASRDGFETVAIRPRFIWGKDDTSILPKLADQVRKGRWAWIDGGHYLTSTCHVDNVVEGALLAAERGRPGEAYFLTDGEPIELRTFMTELFRTQGLEPSDRAIPKWLVGLVARLTGWMSSPPVTRTAVALAGHEVTVIDDKARRDLGYVGKKTREAGLAEMRAG